MTPASRPRATRAPRSCDAASAARTALAGRIDRDMRTAYYRWLEARARRGILEATLELARANRRVNESLYANGKITRDLVYRAEADVLEVEQSHLAADSGVRLAQSYVNLIRNAPFDRPLPLAAVDDGDLERLRAALLHRLGQPSLAAPSLADAAVDRRAELKELDATVAAATAGERLARAAFRPQLALAVDAGTTGEGYNLSAADRYVLASLVLRFSLYSGGADSAGIAAARATGREARAQRGLAEQRIRLEVERALDNLEVALASLGTAAKRVEAARGAFRIAERKRDLGQINQAEFVDARRVLTDADLNQNVTRFAALESLAELEYALGAGARPSRRSRCHDRPPTLLRPLAALAVRSRRRRLQPSARRRRRAGRAAAAGARAPVTTTALGDAVHAVGLLTPKDEARLSFKVGGVIERSASRKARQVSPGQLLAVLRQAEIEAAVDQARRPPPRPSRDLVRARALYADGVATARAGAGPRHRR